MDAKSLEAGYSNNFLLRKFKGYYELMKPRVMSLVIFTAFVGMFLAPGQITFLNSFLVIVAIALGAGSSAAINMWFDEDIDKTMERTKLRPIPLGIVSKNEALVVGILTGTISLILMQWFSNSLATSLLLFTILFYIFIYTFWLKRTTSLNIVIGGAAGAIPPIIGWTAVVPELNFLPISLFVIIFFWTPPHFWALAINKKDEYARAGIPMMPVVKGIEYTKIQIVLYSILLMVVSLLLFATGYFGYLYLIGAAILGGIFIQKSWKLKQSTGADNSMSLFLYSIVYLTLIFLLMIVDRAVITYV